MPELEGQPELYQDLIPYWTAFNELSTSRQMGMGLGYIPYTTIVAWLDENQFTNIADRQDYMKWIQVIDRLYVKYNQPESKENSKKTPNKPQQQMRKALPRSPPRRR